VARSGTVRQGDDFALAVVKLAESRPQGWVGNTVGAGSVEAADFDQLGRGHVCLRLQELVHLVYDVLLKREARIVFRKWETEALSVIERAARQRIESAIPHHGRVERGVDDQGRSPLVARSAAVRSDQIVVLNADGHGLRVAEAIRGRVASAAGVVMM